MKTTILKTIFAVVSLALAGVSMCHGGLLVTYSFTGAAGSEATLPPDADPANGDASVISRGTGLTPSGAGNTFSSSAWTTETSRDANDYYEFTLTPNNGYLMTLTRVETDERRSDTGIRIWEIYSSVDSYATALATFNVSAANVYRTDQGVDLSSSFANLGSGVTFRFYGFDADNVAGTWRVDNVQLFGDITPVPEPVNVALAIFGGIGAAVWGVRRFANRRQQPQTLA